MKGGESTHASIADSILQEEGLKNRVKMLGGQKRLKAEDAAAMNERIKGKEPHF